MQTISEAAAYTLRFINQTQRSVFLTGKAGTGKTTLLREIIETTHKNTVVVAPTGIAALNAGGVTIHSLFQLPFGGFLPDNSAPDFSESTKFETKATLRRHFKMSGLKKSVIRNMELLIIDEVSMLRADLLDAMDFMMQTVRKKNSPFGGVQVLFIGDLLQLPPVIRDDEWRTLKNYYKGKFFFHSQVVQQNPPLYIELDKIFRQTDDAFISVLNNLRNNQISKEDIATLNQYVQPNFDLKANKGYITLTTHNAKADTMNTEALDVLEGKEWLYSPEITGDFPDKIYPVDEVLRLKEGAQIMFVKNDLSFDKKYFNGKMGVIKSLSTKEILVHFPEENKTIEVEKYEWQNIRYKVNDTTKEIEEEVLGTFVHYPIKLAWAITVHKSQGLTFDKVIANLGAAFASGQVYVALSRCTSFSGLILKSRIEQNAIKTDPRVLEFAQNETPETLIVQELNSGKADYYYSKSRESFKQLDFNEAFTYFTKALKFRNDIETDVFRRFFTVYASKLSSYKNKTIEFQESIKEFSKSIENYEERIINLEAEKDKEELSLNNIIIVLEYEKELREKEINELSKKIKIKEIETQEKIGALLLENEQDKQLIQSHIKNIKELERKSKKQQEKHLIELKSLREQLEESEKILNRQNYKISRLEDQNEKYEAEIERIRDLKWYQKLVGFNSK